MNTFVFFISSRMFGRLMGIYLKNDSLLVRTLGESQGGKTVRFLCGAVFLITLIAQSAIGDDTEIVHPWPEWQGSGARLGSTQWRGPKSSRIIWSIRVDPDDNEYQRGSSPVLDAFGRVIAGHGKGVTAVDSQTGTEIWSFVTGDSVDASVSLTNDKVLFGTPEDIFYCVETETGTEVWQKPAEVHPNVGSVVQGDTVFYPSSRFNVYARDVNTGDEVWTETFSDLFFSPPSLSENTFLHLNKVDTSRSVALDPQDGDEMWDFRLTRMSQRPICLLNNRVYVIDMNGVLFCLNETTGDEIWNFDGEFVGAGVTVRSDGISYIQVGNGGENYVIAVSADGDEIWRYEINQQGFTRPGIIDGRNTIYFGTFWANTEGWVTAVDGDGDLLWTLEMPHQVSASPMLAPDGTLYIMCSDKKLYAFRDHPGDLDHDGDRDLADFANFGNCTTEPRVWGTPPNTQPGCELLDFDRDWDVDLTDFGQFQRTFGQIK